MDMMIDMSEDNHKISGIWTCNICVVPEYWISNTQLAGGDLMGKLVIEDEPEETRMARLATEAEVIATEAAKETARLATLNKKPMSEETKAKLKELSESRKAMKAAINAQFDTEGHPEQRLTKSKSKVPVYKDVQKQLEVCTKFSWCIAGSFVQDPKKSGGTLLAIRCENCSATRIIHLADAFHTKLCQLCKGKNGTKSKVGGQSTSGSDSGQSTTVNT